MRRRKTPKLHWQKQYPFALLLIPFISGLLIQNYLLPSWKSNTWLIIVAISVLFALTMQQVKTFHITTKTLRSSGFYIALFALGGFLQHQENIRNDLKWYGHSLKKVEAFQIVVTEQIIFKEKTILIPSKVEKRLINNQWEKSKGKLNIYVYKSDTIPEIPVGSKLVIPNSIIEINSNNNPFNFDYAKFLRRQNIFHQAFLNFEEFIILKNKKLDRPNFIQNIRFKLTKSIDKNVKDQSTQSLIKATLLNDRTTMEDSLTKAYSSTGISHIIAISGMHVSILFGVLLLTLKWIKNKKFHWIKFLLAIPLVWLYIYITNFPPSAVRAAIMFTFLAIGIQTNQKRNGINILAATAFIILIYNPNWFYNVGVQLSFLAVLSIMLFNQKIKKLITPRNFILEYLWNIIAVSISVQILVFPLVIFYFNQFPFWVLLANVPAVIYSMILMCGSLLLFFLDALHIPCFWVGECLGWITHFFHEIIYSFSLYTPKLMQELYLNNFQFILLNLVVISIVLFLFRNKNTYLFLGLSLFVFLFANFIYHDFKAFQQKKIVVYNTSNQYIIDIFQHKRHQYHSDKEISKTTEQYTLFPTRLGFRSLRQNMDETVSEIWKIENKKILHLYSNINLDENFLFPIDYLIISNYCKFEPEVWKITFNPKKIILDGSIPRWKALQWIEKLDENGLNNHWVQEKGAWIFPK